MRFDLREMIEDDMDIVDGLEKVTVLQVNPDTGATLATARKVVTLQRAISAAPAILNDGEIPKRSGRMHIKASSIAFEPSRRDKIVEADGSTWIIESVAIVTLKTRYACEVTEA